MRRPGGYATTFDGDGTITETDTCTCAHCNRVFNVGIRQRAEDIGGLCYVCMKAVCSACVGKGCRPIEKWMQEQEASYHARRSYED